jgi:chromosome partitioning protein
MDVGADNASADNRQFKGGPGKTTVCQVLAAALASELCVVALDADPTQALSRWANNTYEGPSFEMIAEPDETRLAHLIAAKAETCELVLVDTAGFGNRAATVAMTQCRCRADPKPVRRGRRD